MSTTSPQPRPAPRLDVSALTQPLDEAALNAFIADSKATAKPWRQITTGLPRRGLADIVGQLIPVVVPVAGLLVLLSLGGGSLIQAVWQFTFEAPFPLNLVVVGFLALVLIGVLVALVRVVMLIRSLGIPRSWWEAAYRITRFATANGLRYGHDEQVSYPGIIFDTGADRVAERRLTTTAGRRVEIGNYRYTIYGDDRDNARVYGWGYVVITLDRRLPHLLLDAKENNSSVFGIRTSNLPVDLARDQKLSLGGEFDARFTLYAPSDYGRDAFLIFAPDLMALFIDRLGTYDVEIVDDTMFLYGNRFDLLDPRTYDWLQELVDTVIARTLRRTERYRDDFAALETDPAVPQPAGAPLQNPNPPQRADEPFTLLPGFALGGVQPNRPGDALPPRPTEEPVFTIGGDGPPQTATNIIAERGRRLRRGWGFASVVGILLIAFWVYNDLIAPIFGWPRLEE